KRKKDGDPQQLAQPPQQIPKADNKDDYVNKRSIQTKETQDTKVTKKSVQKQEAVTHKMDIDPRDPAPITNLPKQTKTTDNTADLMTGLESIPSINGSAKEEKKVTRPKKENKNKMDKMEQVTPIKGINVRIHKTKQTNSITNEFDSIKT